MLDQLTKLTSDTMGDNRNTSREFVKEFSVKMNGQIRIEQRLATKAKD
jgi:hypothetical protein